PQLTAMGKLFALTRTGLLAVGRVFPFLTAGAAKLGVTLNLSFWPVTLTIAAIVAGIFLLQDAFTYLRGGGDTLTGRVIAWGKTWIDRFARPIMGAMFIVSDIFGRTVTGIRNIGTTLGGIVTRVRN